MNICRLIILHNEFLPVYSANRNMEQSPSYLTKRQMRGMRCQIQFYRKLYETASGMRRYSDLGGWHDRCDTKDRMSSF